MVLFIFSFPSMSQSFELLFEEDVVINDSVFTISIQPDEEFEFEFKIHNTDIHITTSKIVKTYIISDAEDCYDNMCVPPTELDPNAVCVSGDESPEFRLKYNEVSGNAHLTFIQGPSAGTTSILYTIVNLENENDTASFTLSFNCETAVNDDFLSKIEIYPNPADNLIIFNSESSENISLEVCNVLGNVKEKYDILDCNYAIDCSNWSNGYYFFKIISEGVVQKVLKIVISH